MDTRLPRYSFANYYDLIYSWKDYKKETALLRKIIRKHQRSKGKSLLEVACGTGNYIQYLKDDFSIVGTDLSADMLKVARQKFPNIPLIESDMCKVRLNDSFDAIVCLFGSIGYLKTYGNLRKALRNLSRLLNPGGVMLIEPWLRRSTFHAGSPHLNTYSDVNLKVARLCVSRLVRNCSVMDMEFLVAERNGKVRHFVERHELGLFEPKLVLKIMREVGLRAEYMKEGLIQDRGLYVATKSL